VRTAALPAAAIVAAAALALELAACSQDPSSIAAQAKAGDRKGYISGDGTVEKIEPAKRQEPVALAGTTLDGKPWSVKDAAGKAVVVNVWGSWCGPCVSEAPDLEKAWRQVSTARKPVEFIGIDFREDPQRGAAFLKSANITYPSLSDESGVLILALQGKAPTVPTTLVLDTRGRIAARISGPTTAATLTGLVDDVLANT
jgi:thiol-disulfide isomerase/thioredoxin